MFEIHFVVIWISETFEKKTLTIMNTTYINQNWSVSGHMFKKEK